MGWTLEVASSCTTLSVVHLNVGTAQSPPVGRPGFSGRASRAHEAASLSSGGSAPEHRWQGAGRAEACCTSTRVPRALERPARVGLAVVAPELIVDQRVPGVDRVA